MGNALNFHDSIRTVRLRGTSKLADRKVKMLFPGPEAISKIHLTILEFEGLLFNVLLFCRFMFHEIKALRRGIRRKRGP